MSREGQAVSVREPHKGHSEAYLLPGEVAYVIEVRSNQARVRCPASGADMWVDTEILQDAAPRSERVAEALLRLTAVMDDLIREVDLHVYPDDFDGTTHLSSAVSEIRDLLTHESE